MVARWEGVGRMGGKGEDWKLQVGCYRIVAGMCSAVQYSTVQYREIVSTLVTVWRLMGARLIRWSLSSVTCDHCSVCLKLA